MTVFEYVSVLLAIVLGLAVARIMGGLAAFIIAERRVTRDWIVAGWCVALAYMQTVWWLLGWFTFHDRAEISLGFIMYWVGATALISLSSYVLVPQFSGATPSSPTSIPASTPTLRPAFFIYLAGHFGLVFVNGLLFTSSYTGSFVVGFVLVLTGMGYFLRTDRSHLTLLLVWLAFILSVSAWVMPSVGAGSVLQL